LASVNFIREATDIETRQQLGLESLIADAHADGSGHYTRQKRKIREGEGEGGGEDGEDEAAEGQARELAKKEGEQGVVTDLFVPSLSVPSRDADRCQSADTHPRRSRRDIFAILHGTCLLRRGTLIHVSLRIFDEEHQSSIVTLG